MTTTEHTSGASDEARRLRDDAARKAQSLQADATDQVRDRAEHVKDSVAEDVSSVGDALRTASGELRKGSPQAQIFGSLAEQLAGFSDALRGRDVTEIVGEVSAFGRRNPAAFLGGAALLGFAAVRMVRASAPEATPTGSAPMDRPAPSDPLATPAVQSTPATPVMTPPVTPPQEDR
ncbi:hypothetical protein ACFSDD_26345 [Salipiger marinus]|uniref:hypothetical protein n=1 Tax=Salipiger marinus TaxID=555512 RepID=UPI002C93ABF8|nr:hypothetical protein [Salipiger manganoxidans]MEB3420665.1 hypothetical protein [Salipiger manganoxidans]